MRRLIFVWMLLSPLAVHADLAQSTPGDLVHAGAIGALRGTLDAPVRDDKLIERRMFPVIWDAVCHGTPLAKGCQ
jgi:hypothetical protein